jgi:hypothetical protein
MTTAAIADRNEAILAAEERRVPLPLRGDTFLGVFEAIGQDLGINPNWLRVPFAALILVNPMAVMASYPVLGIVVAVSRWVYPVSKRKPAAKGAGAPAPETGNSDGELPIAA